MPELLAALAGTPTDDDSLGLERYPDGPREPGFFGHLDAYLGYVVEEVLPAVTNAFPRIVGGGRVGSAGSSMGCVFATVVALCSHANSLRLF